MLAVKKSINTSKVKINKKEESKQVFKSSG